MSTNNNKFVIVSYTFAWFHTKPKKDVSRWYNLECFSVFRSIKEPVQFWGDIAKQFYWETPAIDDKFFSYNFELSKGDIFIKWMEGASTNISFNLLDKNVKSGNGDKIAFYWWDII